MIQPRTADAAGGRDVTDWTCPAAALTDIEGVTVAMSLSAGTASMADTLRQQSARLCP